MFSGGRPHGTQAWKGIQRHERRPIFFYPVAILRHIWAAHINDRKRNQVFERRLQCRSLHAQATAHGLSNPSALESLSISDSPVLLLPWPEGSEHQPPSINAESPSECLYTEILRKRENTIHLDRVPSFIPVGQPKEAHLNEALHREAARTPISARRIQWEKRDEVKRSTARRLNEKSFLSYDWRVPLQLLKKYYQLDRAVTKRPVNVINKDPVRKVSGTFGDKVLEPKNWTEFILGRYVYDLKSFEPPLRPVSRALGSRATSGRGPRGFPKSGGIWDDVIHREELRRLPEPRIWSAAINFFMGHRMISKARMLFLAMEDLSMHVPVSTINSFMRAAAHQKDLHTFSWLLIIMIRRGFRPDSETWVIFIRCLDSIAVKRFIIREMAALGMLQDSRIRMLITSTTIKDDIVDFLAGKRDPREFLYQMQLRHGPGWLNTKNGNIILNAVSKRISLAAGLDLLEPLKEHGFSPDVVTLNIPLSQTLKRGSLPLAAYVLDIFATKYKVVPDSEGYQRLFTFAQDRGYLNVSRLVWIAACLNGTVTRPMQHKVLYSLRCNAHVRNSCNEEPQWALSLRGKASRVFMTLMGNFVLGLLPFHYHSVADRQWLVRNNVKMAHTAKLKYSLSFNLREAYKMDCAWKIHRGENVEEKLQQRYVLMLVDDGSRPVIEDYPKRLPIRRVKGQVPEKVAALLSSAALLKKRPD